MVGTTIKVRIVEEISPKMTAMAIGVRISAPSPSPIAIGNKPKTVVAVVIKIGLSLTEQAVRMASLGAIPLARRRVV